MNFLGAVNRVLRINRYIKGDDDNIAAFTSTQHAAFIEQAKIAIQSELIDLAARKILPYERASATITTVSGTRIYPLQSNFVRFFGMPMFVGTDNRRIVEYRGGFAQLYLDNVNFTVNTGPPSYWYWEDTTSQTVGLYPTPDSSYNGFALTYYYQKDISVTNESDTIPFQLEIQSQAFCDAAARRMETTKNSLSAEDDPIWKSSRSRLAELLLIKDAFKTYGNRYIRG